MVDIQSSLFAQLTKARSLPHPTARNFDADKWLKSAKELGSVSARDESLLDAAIHFGSEIQILRATYEEKLFDACDQRTAVLLSVAMTNRNFMILTKLADESVKSSRRKKGGPVSIGSITRQPISGPYPGSASNADSSVTGVVDTLPHCMERAMRLPKSVSQTKTDYFRLGTKLFLVLSVEHSLRNLWQAVLWDGWMLERGEECYALVPTDVDLDTLWNVWNWRQEMVVGQSTMLDSIKERLARETGKFIPPFQDPTVVGIGGRSKSERRFKFGSVSGRERGQVWHATEDSVLTESYLAQFLDASLPVLKLPMSCKDLQDTWRVIRDCAAILATKCTNKDLSDADGLERSALMIRRSEVERAVAHCTGISIEKAKVAVEFLTADLSDVGGLFTKGFWAQPIIPIDGGEYLVLVLAALSVSSVVRRIESWLDKGG